MPRQVVIFRRNLQYGLAGLGMTEDEYVYHGAEECTGDFNTQEWTGRICFSGPGTEGGDGPEPEAAWSTRMLGKNFRPVECRVGDEMKDE